MADTADRIESPPPADEAGLLASLRAGDADAYERLVRKEGGRLLAVARRILPNEEDAREAVQEAFLAAYKGLPNFDGASLLSTWLHRVAVNAALMRLRSKRRRPEASLDALLPRYQDDGHQVDPPAPWQQTADQLLERQETRELVRASIDQLPESYRTVLLLRDIEGMDTEETARMLGVNEGVVKTRLHRARQALRTLLDPHVRGGDA
jgi:RNA polymerase sigma-70 factor (ECF subfamily)